MTTSLKFFNACILTYGTKTLTAFVWHLKRKGFSDDATA